MDLSVGRLLTLLELLQAHRRLSAAEIASRLEIGDSERPVVRGRDFLGRLMVNGDGDHCPCDGRPLRVQHAALNLAGQGRCSNQVGEK